MGAATVHFISEKRIEQRDAAPFKITHVTRHKHLLMDLRRSCNEHIRLGTRLALSGQRTSQSSRASGNFIADDIDVAVRVQKPFEPGMDLGVRLPGQAEKDLLDRDDTQRNGRDRLRPRYNGRVGLSAGELADDVRVNEKRHRGAPQRHSVGQTAPGVLERKPFP